MISDDMLQRLMQPIVDRQEKINSWVIEQIAKKIREIGQILPSDVQKLISMRNAGADVKKILKELKRLTGMQIRDIQDLVKMVAKDAYTDAKPFYEYTKTSYIPWDENTQMQRWVEALARRTSNSYRNISNAQAFMLRDPKNPTRLVATPLAKAYQSVVDEAVQASSTGGVDYNTAMRKTLQQLVDSGIRRVTYNPESGRTYTQRLDTAVRRNLMDGLRQVNQEVQNKVGEEFGADGVEISVHSNPAPDHAAMQGHQFQNKEFDKMQHGQAFKDVQGRDYQGFERAVGTLNCRHFAYSIIIGAQKQNYTDAQLKEILDKNEKGYTFPDGRHFTMYECTQYQRQLETKVRYAKEGYVAAEAAGDSQLMEKYKAKVKDLTTKYGEFSRACGLSEKRSKMQVAGY